MKNIGIAFALLAFTLLQGADAEIRAVQQHITGMS